MFNSQVRSSFTAQKVTERDDRGYHYQQMSQKSPDTSSPNLNEQKQRYTRDGSDLQVKLEILLKHNSQLLNQNAQLSELVNELRAEVQIRIRRQETQYAKMNQQMGTAMIELKTQQETHHSQLERLLNQISKLHDQCHQLQIDKESSLRRLQESHERDMVQQIAKVRNSQNDGKNLMQLQINKLKQALEMKDFQYESLQNQMKSQVEQAKNQNSLLQNQIQHQRRLKDIELNELSRRNKDDMRAALKHLQLEKNVQIRQFQNRILKLKKDLTNKDTQIEQQAKKTIGQNQQIYLQLSSIKKQKQYLLDQIQTLTENTQNKIVRQKERTAQMSALEKENLQTLFNNQKQALIGQKTKLMQLCTEKSQEIKRLYINLQSMKENADLQRTQMKKIIQELRNRLRANQKANLEANQLLKIKMAQLHRADVESMEKFYQNQIAGLHLQLKTIKETTVADRETIYSQLQQNDELRKNFEIQISKQKAKIQDMKVKFAAARLQFKEQITSLGTKMELTSQSLVRQTQQKQRGAQFFETQKRKFYQLIEAKDKQIQSIHETMVRLKEINEEEITHQKSQINMLRDALMAKDDQIKQIKNSLQQDFKRKSMKLIQQQEAFNPDDQLEKEFYELKQKFKEIEQENFKQIKEIQFLKRQNNALTKELGLKAGFIESMHLQSCAAIQDEKQKIKVLMGKSQVAMKDYYQMRIQSNQQDIKTLKSQLSQKQADLRSVVSKYHHIEKRLRQLLQAQDKLSDFQNKIVHLGLDQNLIKNMAELFTPQKK